MGWDGHVQALGALPDHGLRRPAHPEDNQLAGDHARATRRPTSRWAPSRTAPAVELFIKNAFDSRGQVNRYTPCTIGDLRRRLSRRACPPAVYVVPIQPLTVGIKLGQTF